MWTVFSERMRLLHRQRVKICAVVFLVCQFTILSLIYRLSKTRELPTDPELLCAEQFLKKYEEHCVEMTSAGLIKSLNNTSTAADRRPLCPCVPSTLLGRGGLNVSLLENITLALLQDKYWDRHPDGHWSPDGCRSRQKIAVIIPFYNRTSHLIHLLDNLHTVLRRQLLDFTIFVIEQAEPFSMFNRGTLSNVGFIEAKKRGPFDCYIFHDVDMLVEDDRGMYTCSTSPRHLGAYIQKYGYSLNGVLTVGGVTAFTGEQFELINGFTNKCEGWGGEDNDMDKRLSHLNVTFTRDPPCVSRYYMIQHGRDKKNPFGPCSYAYSDGLDHSDVYDRDGLNSVQYSLLNHWEYPLYTWLHAKLLIPATNNIITTKYSTQGDIATNGTTAANNILHSRPTQDPVNQKYFFFEKNVL